MAARRVVLIAYFFPPTGGVSVARMLRVSEYLPRYGWESIVIAPRSSGHSIQDRAGMTAIPSDLQVIWTRCPEPAKAKNMIRTHLKRQLGTVDHPPGLRRRSWSPTTWASRAGARLSVLAHQFLFPDEQIAWLPFAVGAAVEAARKHGADAILSTSSPATAHLAAMLASRIVGVPWVADFRDPWAGNALFDDPPLIGPMRWKLERRFIMAAAEMTFATPSMTKLYQSRYPAHARRMRTVSNGYDTRERVEQVAHDSGHFTLVHAGSLYRPPELEVFLAGLQSLVTTAPETAVQLRVRFVGSSNAACAALLQRAAASAELAPIIDVVGPVPRAVALGMVRASDAALLLLPEGPGSEVFASGKLYDYIGRDRQVLAVIPEKGEAAQVLHDLDWGIIAAPTRNDVARGIREIMGARPTRTVADPEGRFDWVNLTGQFAAALDGAAPPRIAATTDRSS